MKFGAEHSAREPGSGVRGAQAARLQVRGPLARGTSVEFSPREPKNEDLTLFFVFFVYGNASQFRMWHYRRPQFRMWHYTSLPLVRKFFQKELDEIGERQISLTQTFIILEPNTPVRFVVGGSPIPANISKD